MSRFFSVGLAAATLIAAAGCSSENAAESGSRIRADSAGGLVIAPSTPYKPTDSGGAAALVVTLAGDSTAPASTPGSCTADPSGGETVFWVDGIREGKALPRERRYNLAISACGFEPHLQAVVVGGTINVFNDAGAHRLIFIRAGTTDTLQTMPFSSSGSLVATERLTKTPGIVEVRCAQHPNETAHVAVFDHPYFGVAGSGEKVILESIPAGDYRLLTWHEGMPAPSTVPTRVGPSGQTEVILK